MICVFQTCLGLETDNYSGERDTVKINERVTCFVLLESEHEINRCDDRDGTMTLSVTHSDMLVNMAWMQI